MMVAFSFKLLVSVICKMVFPGAKHCTTQCATFCVGFPLQKITKLVHNTATVTEMNLMTHAKTTGYFTSNHYATSRVLSVNFKFTVRIET